MQGIMEMKFEKYKKDERCKKLERSLRLVMLKKNRKVSNENQSNSALLLPSVLSINADTRDFNETALSTRSFQTENEVVSFSNNLQNIMAKKGKTYGSDNKIFTSSSIKQSLADKNYFVNRRSTILSHNSGMSHGQFEDNPKILKRNLLKNGDYSSPIEKNSCHVMNNKNDDMDNSVSPKVVVNNIKHVNERTFFSWRVMLNDHGNLLIKGKLESGKAIHSKPIMKRLTATTVQSIFNHIYHLDGSIVDNRNELPEYVRGKFHNGFPDDWENVYQIWLLYVSQGSKPSFHWPTKITDSDDDLKSEVTDCTFLCAKKDKNKRSKPLEHSDNPTVQDITQKMRITSDLNVQPSPSDVCSNDSKVNTSGVKTNNSSNSEAYLPTLKNTFISIAKTKVPDWKTCNKENQYKHEHEKMDTMFFRKGYTMKDVMRQDTIDIIIRNLLHKDCPKEYILKILQMFDFIDDVLSYRIGTEETNSKSDVNEESLAPLSKTDKKESGLYTEKIQDNKTEINSKSSMQERTNISPMKQHIDHSVNNRDMHKISSRILEKQSGGLFNTSEKENDILKSRLKMENSDESENETYTGVPKIISDYILKDTQKYSFKRTKYKKKRKTTDLNPMTRSDVKSYKRFKTDQARMQRSYSSDTDVETRNEDGKKGRQENITKTPVTSLPCRKICDNVQYDSSVSITEDEELQMKEKLDHAGVGKKKETDNSIYNRVFNSSSTDDDIKLSKSKYENTRKIGSHRPKEPKIVNNNDDADCTIDTLDKSYENDIGSYVDIARYNVFENTDSKNAIKHVITAETASSSTFNNINKRNQKSKLDDKAFINNGQINQCENSSKARQIQREYECPVELGKTREKDKSIDYKKEIETRNGDNKILSRVKDSTKSKVVSSDKCKLLYNWVPRIVYNTKPNFEANLVFEGKLLNEAGHVIDRKFVTEHILKRISPVIVETTNHELYKLVGDLHDPKHVVPKEIARYCHKGCPSNINEFCKLWKSLQEDNTSKPTLKEEDEIATNLLNVPTSSRGRRKFPPLRYWTGERVMVKDNKVVYTTGNCTNFAKGSLTENTKDRPILQEGNKHKEHLKTVEPTRMNTTNEENPNILKYNRTLAEKAHREEGKRYGVLSDASENDGDNVYHVSKQRIGNYVERNAPYNTRCKKTHKTSRDGDVIAQLNEHLNKHNTKQESPIKVQNVKYSCYRGLPPADILSDDQMSQF